LRYRRKIRNYLTNRKYKLKEKVLFNSKFREREREREREEIKNV